MPRWLPVGLSVLVAFGCDNMKPTTQPTSLGEASPTPIPSPVPAFLAADWDGPDHLLLLTSAARASVLTRRDVRSGTDEHLMDLPLVPAPAVFRATPSSAAVVPLLSQQILLIDRLTQHAVSTSLGPAASVEWLDHDYLVAVEQGEASDNGSLRLLRRSDNSWGPVWRTPAPRRLSDFSASCAALSDHAVMVLEQDPSPHDPSALVWSIGWWVRQGNRLVERQRHVLPAPGLVYGGVAGDCMSAMSIDFDRQGNGAIVAVNRESGAVQRVGSLSVPEVPVDTDLRLSPDGRRLLAVLSYGARSSSYVIVPIDRPAH